jgi:hypothetical protein
MKLIPNEDYYTEGGLMVMTAAFHRKRGACCGNTCRHCPFVPKHQEGATSVTETAELQGDVGTASNNQPLPNR